MAGNVSRDKIDEFIAELDINPMIKVLLSQALLKIPDILITEIANDLDNCIWTLEQNSYTKIIVDKWRKRLFNEESNSN